MLEQTEEMRLKDARILIVDDDREVLEAMNQALQAEGALTQTCGDGNSAVRVCEVDPPDLVVLDIRMPNMDGLEALGNIVQHHKKVPVIINTAHAYYQDNFISWLADAYITKSPDLTELKETISDLLAKAE